MNAIYDHIGLQYAVTRCTDPHIAQLLSAELQGATRLVNIGAGTGSYEPENVALVAVEPAAKMIAQRKRGAPPVVQAVAEALPFENQCFSHALTVLSMHHWENRQRAFDEIKRVTTAKFVAITWDPHAEPFWLTRDYFPEIYAMDQRIFPRLAELQEHFSDVKISPLPIPSDCQDGLLAAFWKRPAAYLKHSVRQSMSPFARIKDQAEGLQKLAADLASGAWAQNNQALLNLSFLDVGYRIISAQL